MATSLLMQPLVTLPSAAGLVGTGGGESSGRQQLFCSRGTENCWKPRRNFVKLSCSAESEIATSGSTAVELTPPVINLEFLGPETGGEVTTASVGSGEKLLRTIILDNKLELYGLYGKVMNCGGGGSCGTCVVEILEGKELLNERTDVEYKYLKKKPESWRLSCQTIVGDKSNSGKVVVQRLPQKKKA